MLAVALLPGVGRSDPRVSVDPEQPPWTAVARLNIPGAARCTAVFVDPHWAVTAGHCVHSKRLGRVVPPTSIHLLIGYSGGAFTRHLLADEIRLLPGAAPGAAGPRGDDVALLHVAGPVSSTLPPDPVPVVPGTPLMTGGYGQDRTERLSVDPGCHAVGVTAGVDGLAMLLHDCAGTRGTSGGPVLAEAPEGGWRLVGLAVGARADRAGGVAVTGGTLDRLLTLVAR